MGWAAPTAVAAVAATTVALMRFNYVQVDVALVQLVVEFVKQNYLAVVIAAAILSAILLRRSRPAPVLLRDFVCYQPDSSLKVSRERFMSGSRAVGAFTENELEFMERILRTNGVGEETYFPPAILKMQFSLSAAREEAEMVMFGCMDRLLERTGVDPKAIDFVITNCSLFCPTPSLSAMLVNRYKMRSDVINYNLGGMGCSAGIIAIDLARRLLNDRPNSLAVVVSTENITQNWYLGKDKAMLLPNTLFRLGCSAVMLTNKPGDRRRCRYRLVHTLRTHAGSDDDAFRCVFQEPDTTGIIGVRLDKKLMQVAGRTLTRHITQLGPLVLPLSEKLKYVWSLIRRKAFRTPLRALLCRGETKPPELYMPDFTRAFNHFCIHAGGRAVIDEMEKNLRLAPRYVLPSRATLFRWGNVSSASVWYELAFSEKHNLVRKGHRVWQIAFGSGFKVNSAVWEALCTVDGDREWAYLDFPYAVPESAIRPPEREPRLARVAGPEEEREREKGVTAVAADRTAPATASG